MEKVINKHLTISSVNRGVERLEHEIYSKDKGTAVFKFTIDELTASKVLCLFYFNYTKRYRTVEATIEGNTITVPFDSSLITTDEPVIGYIYFEKVEKSTDVYSFVFNVRVSAIDKAQETPLIERTTGRVVDVENIVTKQELDELFAKIKVQGGTYDDSGLRSELGNNVDRFEIERISRKIEALEQKTDKDTIYNDESLKQRLLALESKPTIDTSVLVTKQELESKRYLTEHQPLTEYAKKSELPQPYNDVELKSRVARLESKHDVDTSNFATKQELQNIALTPGPKGDRGETGERGPQGLQGLQGIQGEKGQDGRDGVGIPQTLSISGNSLSLSHGGGTVTLPVSGQSGSTSNSTASTELNGKGIPEGRVEGSLGQTYIDTSNTNGALKWIKTTPSGKSGWEVLHGDTGWKKFGISSGYNQATLRVRRVNNIVTYQFGGLKNDAFGIVRRGGPGYLSKQTDTERDLYILFTNRIPLGYRSVSSLSGTIFKVDGNMYGSWFIGGINNGNYLSLHFTDPVPEDNNIEDIIISSIMYVTNDPWPK